MDNCNSSSVLSEKPNSSDNEEETVRFDLLQNTPQRSLIKNMTIEHLNFSNVPLKTNSKSAAVITIQGNREREKRELNKLNDRFASYIERVRFLEAQNKKFQMEIDDLKDKWHLHIDNIKATYQTEISEARNVIDTTVQDCAEVNLRAKTAEQEALKIKEKCQSLLDGRDADQKKLEVLQNQLLNNEADLNLFRRRLTDLEDEHKRFNNESERLTCDIQRITKELDQETLTRIKLENQKENLEKEIQFLKEIHQREIEDLKQVGLQSKTLDPAMFFKHELSNAVQNIRKEYEQANHMQRHELEFWYESKALQAIREIQVSQVMNKPKEAHHQDEIRKLRKLVEDSQKSIASIRQRNDELDSRVQELEKLIRIERNENTRAIGERDSKIRELRLHLEALTQNYDELITTKTSLDSEIATYKALLEGEDKKEGLKQILASLDNNTQDQFFVNGNESILYFQSDKNKSDNEGLRPLNFKSGPPVLFQSGRLLQSQPTLFQHVYTGHRQRRSEMLWLNAPWMMPFIRCTDISESSESTFNSRNLKTKTFFETDLPRKQQQGQAPAPPDSDYRSTFTHALVSNRHTFQLRTPFSTTVESIPLKQIATDLFAKSPIKTSETRFNHINASNSFDEIASLSPNGNSMMTSNFVTTPPNFAHPPSATQFTNRISTYSSKPSPTSKLEYAPSHTTQTSALPSSPSIITYKPSIVFQSAPLSFWNNGQQTDATKHTTSSSSTSEKPMDLSKTNEIQHGEDSHSSLIERTTKFAAPPISESSVDMTGSGYNTITSSNSSAISDHIIHKYDSLINQISEILASVSPLGSTGSSESLGQSILDYEFSPDGSPDPQSKLIEPQSPKPTATSTSAQHLQEKYLIRKDSYDKIVDVIADLDSELTPPPPDDTAKLIEPTKENDNELLEDIPEKTKISSWIKQTEPDVHVSSSCENNQNSTLKNEDNETAMYIFIETEQLSLIADEDEVSTVYSLDLSRCELPAIPEMPSEEESLENSQENNENSINNIYCISPVTDLSPCGINDPILQEEQSQLDDEESANGNTVHYTTEFVTNDCNRSPNKLIERSNSIETLDSVSDHADRRSMSSGTGSMDTQYVIDNSSLKPNISSATSYSWDKINVNEIAPCENFVQSINDDGDDFTSSSVTDNEVSSSLPIIVHPTDVLPQNISTRYISSDVYHGYQGERRRVTEDPFDMNTKMSLLNSLRQTIESPDIPLIETIQEFVSSMQTMTSRKPLKNEQGMAHKIYSEIIPTPENEPWRCTSSTNKVECGSDEFDDSCMETMQAILSHLQIEENKNLIESTTQPIEMTPDDENKKSLTIVQPWRNASRDEKVDVLPNKLSTVESLVIENISTYKSIERISMNEILTITEKDENESIENGKHELTQQITASENMNSTNKLEIITPISTDAKTSVVDTEDKNSELQIKTNTNVMCLEALPNEQQILVKDPNPFEQEKVAAAAAAETVPEVGLISAVISNFINNVIRIALLDIQQQSIDPTRDFSNLIYHHPMEPTFDSHLEATITTMSELKSDSTLLSNIRIDPYESSATNTEPDSLELIHALRGHSMIISQQLFRQSEKSPSTRTSSQVTSSDRYVSKAIHEMGDSSQERLPTISIAADMPMYKNTDEDISLKPMFVADKSTVKENDSTEFDVTDNMTSYLDDILSQPSYLTDRNQQKSSNASSTDEDADDEFEQHSLSHARHMIDGLTPPSMASNENYEAYQCYDLATTPSSNDSSSPSSRQRSDDVYLIPGYPGLWRPSTSSHSPVLTKEYDADDESRATTDAPNMISNEKHPLFSAHYHEQRVDFNSSDFLSGRMSSRPNTMGLLNRSSNVSESDSYQTCPSSISKHQKPAQTHERLNSDEPNRASPDERILLIRERERGVSLPICMKIDCDTMPLRLSASTPIDTEHYSTLPMNLSSSSLSFHSELPFPINLDLKSRQTVSSLNNHDKDKRKLPPELNSTAAGCEDVGESRTTIFKSAKGPISISQCDPQGRYITVENTSQSKCVDLSNWMIRQEDANGNNLVFTFPWNCHLKPNHSFKILTNIHESVQRSDDLIASCLSSWYRGPNVITTLYNAEGKDRSRLIRKTTPT